MMQLTDQLQFEPSIPVRLAPYLEQKQSVYGVRRKRDIWKAHIDNTTSVPGEQKLPLEPLVTDTLVEHAG